MDSHCLWLTNSLWPIAGRRRRHTEDSPLIGGELSIPPDEGETDEPRRATFSIAGGGDDGGGGAVDDAAAICPSVNGKTSMCPLTASMGILAERFIHAMLSGWAYGAIYRNSD